MTHITDIPPVTCEVVPAMTVDELAATAKALVAPGKGILAADGTPLPQVLTGQGIICGIKVDTGTTGLAGFPGEKIAQGLDGLAGRLPRGRAGPDRRARGPDGRRPPHRALRWGHPRHPGRGLRRPAPPPGPTGRDPAQADYGS